MSERLRLHPRYQQAIEQAGLTAKQERVLDLWLKQHSMRRIALALDISESTARGHFEAALRKMRPYVRKDEAA